MELNGLTTVATWKLEDALYAWRQACELRYKLRGRALTAAIYRHRAVVAEVRS